ncbi:iron chelate uptake ABC transporter family permease subunit [Prauserella sp. ASG 168]|uniref:Iron chelate uptake ABC transporter family permease subunit n=2 Tax=Prauserella cavernicola TaxID=2800127 RepID=A0A934V7J5_9PSEU|nr:iron chelate uptake ABC transporter family permease subunit [Prauserella cavernicola]
MSAALFIISGSVAVVAITYGDYPLGLDQVLAALAGSGEQFHRMIVVEWRLPVAAAAVVFGALLGIGGAIFQSLTRNPLGSPDVIGFDAGSYTAVVVTILVLGSGSYWSVASAAIIGGLGTAFAVYAIAYRRGIQGFRLIVVGIGVSAMLGAINAYLITRADVDDAMVVGFWGAGSIARVSWTSMIPSLVIALLIVVAASLLSPALRTLELGDDAATTQGARPGLARLALLTTGVATVALVTAAAGPIGFVALVAPQLARRLTGSPGVSLLAASGMGAALLACAHLLSLVIAQFYRAIPVGLITVCLGGIYLVWLLIREARTQYGTPR